MQAGDTSRGSAIGQQRGVLEQSLVPLPVEVLPPRIEHGPHGDRPCRLVGALMCRLHHTRKMALCVVLPWEGLRALLAERPP